MANDADTKRIERLRALVDPATTAVVTNELQNGVVGEQGMLRELVDQVRARGTIDAAAAVCQAARETGVTVVHATAAARRDGKGAVANCTIFGMADKLRREQGIVPNEIGTPGAAVVAELGPEPDDVVVERIHGMTPFTSTSLDQILRNLGVRTIVAVGVSANLGITGLCMSAVDLGYQVVLVRDAVAGVPADYADAVIDNTLAYLATLTTSAELTAIWTGRS